jgi:hypothetical protein
MRILAFLTDPFTTAGILRRARACRLLATAHPRPLPRGRRGGLRCRSSPRPQPDARLRSHRSRPRPGLRLRSDPRRLRAVLRPARVLPSPDPDGFRRSGRPAHPRDPPHDLTQIPSHLQVRLATSTPSRIHRLDRIRAEGAFGFLSLTIRREAAEKLYGSPVCCSHSSL